MKLIGKVIDYNGYDGYIIIEDGNKFILSSKDIMGSQILKNDDLVIFNPEKYKEHNVARFIAKYNEENQSK